MLRRFSINSAIAAMLFDLAMVAVGMKLSSLLVPDSHNFHLLAYFGFPFIWWLIFLAGALYDGSRNLRIVDELSLYLSMSALASISLAGLAYLSGLEITRFQFLTFIGVTIFLQVLLRSSLRLYWRLSVKKSNGNGGRRVLIIGAGELGRRVRSEIHKYAQESPVQVLGFVDDAPYKLNLPGVLGTVSETPKLIQEHHISDVVITLPASAHELRK